MYLRNRFLNTASFLSGPNDPPGSGEGDGKPTVLKEDVGAEDDTGGTDDTGGAQDDTGGADDDTGADDEDGADADEDEDPDLAALTPEAKAAAKKFAEKQVKKETGWRDKQIDKLHARRRSAEEDVRAVETIAQRQPGAAQGDPDKKYTQADVKAEAARLSAQEQYDRDCNDTFAKGSDIYGDKWNGALNKIPKLGGLEVNDMMDINATDKPHVVMFHLADPEVYERVMALPPAKRRTEFVKLALKSEPKKAAAAGDDSRRPADQAAPVKPLQNGRRVAAQQVNLYDDKADDAAWYAARNASRRKKFANVE